jgi:hypothetical protein
LHAVQKNESTAVFRMPGKYQHLVSADSCRCCDPRFVAFAQRASAEMSRRGFMAGIAAATSSLGSSLGLSTNVAAQSAQPTGILFENVRVFDGKADQRGLENGDGR